MQYMLLIYDDETLWERLPAGEIEQVMQEFGKFTTDLQESGAFVSASRLQPTANATSVRVRDGERLVTDGPFAETKEQLGGYYVVEADSLDDALAWAAKIPSARYGTVEVRPLWNMAPGDAEQAGAQARA